MRKIYFLFLLICQCSFSQQITQVEYWFGNDFGNRVLQAVTVNGNDETDLSIPFPDNDTNQINDFIHFRFNDSNGNWSAVYSQQMHDAEDTNAYLIQMEYWFDSDFANRAIVLPTQFMGNNGLDHQEADIDWQPNAQTIYYRFKSKYNQWSAIQSSHIDAIENRNNQISSAEFWLNDDFEARQIIPVGTNNSFYLDLRQLIINTDVQETIHLRYKDRTNRWSSIYSFHSDYQGDLIEPAPVGAISLSASKLPAGKINLTWNSVENAKLYLLYRDGQYWSSLENSHHPQSLEASDFPPLGNHSYYVVAKNYLNPNGLTSNTADETINQSDIDAQDNPANTILYGTLNGMITDAAGNRIDDVLITYSHDGYSVYSNLGQFKRDGILYGTQGNITLSKPGFSFAAVNSFGYDIHEPLQNLAFIGTSENTANPIENTQVFALGQTTGFMTLTADPKYKSLFETSVTIKNIGLTAWSGKIHLVANKTASAGWNPYTIIDELQVSNLGGGQERLLEFTTSALALQPGDYSLKILAYRIDGNLNSTIQDVMLNESIANQNNNITVDNIANIQTLQEALDLLKLTLEGTQFFTNLLVQPDDSQTGTDGLLLNQIFQSVSDGLETSADAIEKITNTINVLNTYNALVNAENEKDYWKAIRNLMGFCDNTVLCKFLEVYLDVANVAIQEIEDIENLSFAGYAEGNFNGSSFFRLKVLKTQSFFGVRTYYNKTDFISQIKSVEYIGLNINNASSSASPCDIQNPYPADTENLYVKTPEPNGDNLDKYFIKIVWTNNKITLIPFSSEYSEFVQAGGNYYDFELDAKKAGGNAANIKKYATVKFN
ncbi:hypothetical protein [Flavobacterium sp.]|uniref:hypothetical protein n=1 Tax=Flavobacterium sp. TaxID=239 RepID=UPI00262E79A4|nr:hypothetical protein [Flavobacterium sp.]